MKRYSSVDGMRAIAAFLIVCIHIPFPSLIGEIVTPLARIGVPFFFMVSGFFMWEDNIKKLEVKIKKQLNYVLQIVIHSNLLYFIWNTLIVLYSGKVLLVYLDNTFTMNNFLKFVVFNESPFGGHLWYLSAILYVLIIYYFINRFDIYKIAYFMIPILLLSDLILGKYSLVTGLEVPFIFVRNFIFVGLPYFLLGNWMRKRVENTKIKNYHNKLILSGIIFFSFTTLLEKYLLIINNLNAPRDHYISTTLLVICLFVYLIKNPNLFENSTLEKIGKSYSLLIYIIHPTIISILSVITNQYFDMLLYIGAFVVYFLSLVFSSVYLKLRQSNINI